MFSHSTENRSQFLWWALMLEDAISSNVSKLLDINDYEKTLSFGNKSSALSFRSKINLLLDLKILDKNDNWKLEKFMEIRNQFAHNIAANTYVECTDFIDGARNKLFKEYPQDPNLSLEEQTKKAALSLAADTLRIIHKVFDSLLSKGVSKEYKRMVGIDSFASMYAIRDLEEKAQNSSDPDKISLSEYYELKEMYVKSLEDDENFKLDVNVRSR